MLSKSSVLHYWSSRYGINPRVGGRPVFSRNSAASFDTQEGEINQAIVNTPRFGWETVSGERRKVLTLELARTNLNTALLTAWSSDGASLTGSQADPAGGTAGVKVLQTGGNGRAYSGATFTGDGTKAVAIAVRAGDAAQSFALLYDVTAAAARHGVYITWTNGVPEVTTGSGGGTIFPVQPLMGGWYLISFSATGVVAANSNRVELSPDTSGTGKFMYAYKPNFENGPFATSLLDPSSTRATDSCYWNFPPVPQAKMVYVRFVEAGTKVGDSSMRVFQIGNAGDTGARFAIYADTDDYWIYHNNGSTAVSAGGALVSPAIGDTVEHVAMLASDGKVRLIQSINGAAVGDTGASGTNSLPSAWADTRLWLNSAGTATPGSNKFAEGKFVKYADVVASTAQGIMDELRAFELGPNSEVL